MFIVNIRINDVKRGIQNQRSSSINCESHENKETANGKEKRESNDGRKYTRTSTRIESIT